MKFLKIILLLIPASLHAQTWVVFVHGTIGGTLALYHVNEIKKNNVLDGSSYARQVERYRKKELNSKDRLLLDYGLIPIPTHVPAHFLDQKFDPALPEYGAYVIVGAFDSLMQQVGYLHQDIRYFTFGWSGLLSQRHRQIAGFDLYNALCNARDAQEEKPIIIVVGYSHGGNVPLWFEEAEHYFKRNLEIDTLITLGCPLQVETVFATASPVFKHIYTIRSDGDLVPQADRISTQVGKSSARLHDFLNPAELNAANNRHVCDIRILVNGNIKSVDHRSFFNLCYKKKILPELSGLPFLMFIPHILPILHANPNWSNMDLHLNVDAVRHAMQIAWSEYQSPVIKAASDNIYPHFCRVRSLTDQYWSSRIVKSGDDLTPLDNILLLPATVTLQTESLIDRLRNGSKA